MSRLCLALLLVLLSLQTGFAEPLPENLQGRWRASGQLPAPKGQHSMSWMLEYTFGADGSYKMTGYPSISESGVVQVAGLEGRSFTLKFGQRVFMNRPAQDVTYAAELSEDGQILKFHDKVFIRSVVRR